MHVADHLSLEQLQALADQEAGKARFLRLRAVILALGRPVRAGDRRGPRRRPAHRPGVGQRYNAEGLGGLVDRPGRGRPCRLTEAQLAQLRDRIDAGPAPEDGACTLRGPEVRALPRARVRRRLQPGRPSTPSSTASATSRSTPGPGTSRPTRRRRRSSKKSPRPARRGRPRPPR